MEYQISERDFVVAGKLATKTHSKLAVYWRYIPAVFGAILLVPGFIFALYYGSPIGALLALPLGLILIISPILSDKRFSEQYRKTPMLKDSRSLDIDDSGLRFRTANSDVRTMWEPYRGFAENDQIFIVFPQTSPVVFLPIPKRALSAVQITELRSLLETHLRSK
jgi:hypothetical protein